MIDLFDGERAEVEDLSDDELAACRLLLLQAINDPGDVTPDFIYRDQIKEIDDENVHRYRCVLFELGAGREVG